MSPHTSMLERISAVGRYSFPAVATVVYALVCGCASQGKQPTDELTKARAVIEQADKGNAQRYAAADLQRAHDELNDAERANNEKKYIEARRYAQKAEADADLANARGRSGETQASAMQVDKDLETLRRETQRGTSNMNQPSGTTAPEPTSAPTTAPTEQAPANPPSPQG